MTSPKNKSIFSYVTNEGYSIVEIEHPGKNASEIEQEATEIAKAVYNSEEYSTSLSVTDVRAYVTDGWPFSFSVDISPNRQTAKVKICIDDGENRTTETMTFRV